MCQGDIDMKDSIIMYATNAKKQVFGIRQLAFCLTLMLSIGLAGCGGGGSGSDGSSSSDTGSDSVVGVKSTGSAALSWVAPSTRVDNTALPMSEIGGYKVYMGSSVDTLVLYEDINDPYQMELVVNELAAGTYYFAVTAYNQYGAESDFSAIASKTI